MKKAIEHIKTWWPLYLVLLGFAGTILGWSYRFLSTEAKADTAIDGLATVNEVVAGHTTEIAGQKVQNETFKTDIHDIKQGINDIKEFLIKKK